MLTSIEPRSDEFKAQSISLDRDESDTSSGGLTREENLNELGTHQGRGPRLCPQVAPTPSTTPGPKQDRLWSSIVGLSNNIPVTIY